MTHTGWRTTMTTADRPKKPGRPITRKVKIDDTAEEIARSIFRAANPPDPSKRQIKQPRS